MGSSDGSGWNGRWLPDDDKEQGRSNPEFDEWSWLPGEISKSV